LPTYQFECAVCGHVHSVVMKMSEYDEYSKECSQPNCGGQLIQDYSNRDTQNFILQGSGWTPRSSPVNAPDTRFKPKNRK
jgi:putative FmdB family regulatory protein